MTNESPIGVFDSGIGGLTVVKSIIERLPNENIVYFGDTAHVPYGTRSKRQITNYVLNDVKFLNSYNVKAIVIACNTADSVARESVEQQYDMPVFGVVDPASRMAAETTKNGKIGVIATNATIRSKSYSRTIAKYNPDARVIGKACPLLVPLVENGRFQPGDIVIETVLREYLVPLVVKGIDTLVLGCTHYPLLYGIIKSMFPKLQIISSSVAAAKTLQDSLEKDGLVNDGRGGDRKYFVSDDAEGFEQHAGIFMDNSLNGNVEQVSVE